MHRKPRLLVAGRGPLSSSPLSKYWLLDLHRSTRKFVEHETTCDSRRQVHVCTHRPISRVRIAHTHSDTPADAKRQTRQKLCSDTARGAPPTADRKTCLRMIAALRWEVELRVTLLHRCRLGGWVVMRVPIALTHSQANQSPSTAAGKQGLCLCGGMERVRQVACVQWTLLWPSMLLAPEGIRVPMCGGCMHANSMCGTMWR